MEGGSEYVQTVQKALARLKELEVSKSWKENGTSPCAMFKLEIGDRVGSKGIDKVNYNIEKVIEFLAKEDSLKKMNPQLL
jgi:hypothetical protein